MITKQTEQYAQELHLNDLLEENDMEFRWMADINYWFVKNKADRLFYVSRHLPASAKSRDDAVNQAIDYILNL